MSMRPTSSPMPSFPPLRRAYVPRAQLSAVTLALGLLVACTAIASPAPAQTLGDTASIDRTLGVNAPAFHALMEGRVGDASIMLRSTLAANPADATAHQV